MEDGVGASKVYTCNGGRCWGVKSFRGWTPAMGRVDNSLVDALNFRQSHCIRRPPSVSFIAIDGSGALIRDPEIISVVSFRI